jgi:ATP-dependent DNA helicase RecG
MTTDELKEILARGEDISTEYKKCKDELGNSVYETVCSFSNRYGGYMILGVDDDGTVLGVNPDAAAIMKKNFTDALNNAQKIFPTLHISLEQAEIDGRTILWVYVPPTSQVHRCAGRIYDRNDEGDYDITNATILVGDMYSRKSGQYTERRFIPYATEKHFRFDLLPRVRQLAISENKDHPWKDLSDMDLLRSAGLYEDDDPIHGKPGFNLAAILLLGTDEAIKACVPGYVTDALKRIVDVDRYDDRLMVDTNLIESYDRLMEFIAKHTDDKFYLIDDQRVSIRSRIAREIVANILEHREYSSAFPAKLIIEKDRIYTENWSWAQYPGRITPGYFRPYPKNPLIARFFVNIGRADTLGSGVRNLYKFTKMYSGGEPELIEGDVFKIIVPIGNADGIVNGTSDPYAIVTSLITPKVTKEVTDRVTNIPSAAELAVLELLKKNPGYTFPDMAKILSVSRKTVAARIKSLKEKQIIRREGYKTKGYWIINHPFDKD